jgi:hypothetical protein
VVTYAAVTKELREYDVKNADEELATRWNIFSGNTPQPSKQEQDAIQAALTDIDPKRRKDTRKRGDSDPRRNVRFNADDPRDPATTPKNNQPVQCMNCGSEAQASKNCPQPQKTCNHRLKVATL